MSEPLSESVGGKVEEIFQVRLFGATMSLAEVDRRTRGQKMRKRARAWLRGWTGREWKLERER
jgi:hypothetical protein